MVWTSNSLQHIHHIQEINIQAVFFVHRCIRMFDIFSFLFHLSPSLRWKTRKGLLYSFFFLSLSWKTRTRNWTEKWRTCRPGTVLSPLLHYSYLNTVYLKNYTGKKMRHYLISNYGYKYCITKIIFVFYISGCSYTHNTVLFHGKGLYVYRSIFNVVLHLSGKPFFYFTQRAWFVFDSLCEHVS